MITEQFLSCNKCEQKIFQTYQNGSPIETFKHILIMTLFSPKFRCIESLNRMDEEENYFLPYLH
jgi:hypothetical protein